jgi:hypothetical protein
VPYDQWSRDGFIQDTEGNVVDYEAVRLKLNQLAESFSHLIRDLRSRWRCAFSGAHSLSKYSSSISAQLIQPQQAPVLILDMTPERSCNAERRRTRICDSLLWK